MFLFIALIKNNRSKIKIKVFTFSTILFMLNRIQSFIAFLHSFLPNDSRQKKEATCQTIVLGRWIFGLKDQCLSWALVLKHQLEIAHWTCWLVTSLIFFKRREFFSLSHDFARFKLWWLPETYLNIISYSCVFIAEYFSEKQMFS